MEYLPGIVITLFISTIVAIVWARAIVNMHEKHPDYKGDDFLNWGDDAHQRAAAGRDGWDSIESDDDWYPHETL
jgi:Na+/citrate or Na+/malate symporter